MIQIDHTVISLDVFEKYFQCELSKCKGACCVYGDSGAPIEVNEITSIQKSFDLIKPFLSEKSLETIRIHDFYYVDSDGDTVTQLNHNKECVFTFFEDGIAYCAIEKAYFTNKIEIRKPISCFLYPIRLTKYSSFIAVNYHPWDICKFAVENGRKNGIRIFETCKDALCQYFGEEWYQKVLEASKYLEKNK
jgi:hypothetical protein